MLGTILLRLVQIGAIVNGAWFSIAFYRKLIKNPDLMRRQNPLYKGKEKLLTVIHGAICGVTMFFDTLGIGGFAPMTALLKVTKSIDDRLLPGTLNTSSLLGASVETLLFVSMVAVDPLTLVCFISAVTIGARFGAKYVSHLPTKPIRIILGIGLIVVAATMVLRQLDLWVPGTGLEIGIYGWKLVVATILAFVVGVLSSAGIGGYAFMIAICYGFGMDPRSAFPIMFGSYSFLELAAGLRFLKEDALDYRCDAVGLITSVIGVLLAFFIVKSMPLDILFWLVIVILLYTSVLMFVTAARESKKK